MHKFLKYIFLFLLPFIGGIVVLFILPVNKEFTYNFVKGECNNKASWIYHRIFKNPKEIDIAFSGASQTSCAIMDSLIEDNLRINMGEELNVANLGYCRRGRDLQYAILKDLFEHKHPKILVVEVAEDEPKKSHPVFPYFANSTDLFGSAVFFNQRYFSAIFKGLVIRFEQLKAQIYSSSTTSENHPDYSYIPTQHVATAETIDENKLAWKNRQLKTKSEFQRKIELNYSKNYLQKIAKLATDNNCQLLLLYLPESGSEINTPLLINFYTELAPVILPKDSTMKNKKNWMDAMHLNDYGAKEISNTLVDKLAYYLSFQN
jgi:hypothetical protein